MSRVLKDSLRITKMINPDEIIESHYGNISGGNWIAKECRRLNSEGIGTTVGSNAQGELAIWRTK